MSVESTVSDIQIDNVQSGEEIRITVEIRSNNRAVLANLERNRESTESLKVEIRPNKWNVDWKNNDDEVIAKIIGDGHDQIKSGSVKLVGPEGDVINPYDEDIGGNFFIAKFYQKDAIALITDPEPGEVYEILVTGQLEDGSTFELNDAITIVGKKKGGGELSLDIRPDKWNVAWTESNGAINAMISGEGFDEIVPSTVKMTGPAGAISPYTYELGGVYFIAKFYQKDAIKLFSDPKAGNAYEIHVTGQLEDGTTFDLKDTITFVGKKE